MYKAKQSRMDKILKNPNLPAQGDYNEMDAFLKTQTKQFVAGIGKEKIKSFTEQYAH